MAGNLRWFWLFHDHHREQLAWLDQALPRAGATPMNVRARALLTAGVLAGFMNELTRSQALLAESVALCRELGEGESCPYLLRDAEDRAHLSSRLAHASPRQAGDFRVHRRLVQPASPSFHPGLPQPRRCRTAYARHPRHLTKLSIKSGQDHTACGRPKAADGPVEMMRSLQVVRRSALKARSQTANQLHALVVTAPDELRTRMRPLSLTRLVATVARFRPPRPVRTQLAATKLALRSLAVRYQQLSDEIAALDTELTRWVADLAPALLEVKGIGCRRRHLAGDRRRQS